MQSVSSRIWTRVAVFISYGDNNYTTDTSQKAVFKKFDASKHHLFVWTTKFFWNQIRKENVRLLFLYLSVYIGFLPCWHRRWSNYSAFWMACACPSVLPLLSLSLYSNTPKFKSPSSPWENREVGGVEESLWWQNCHLRSAATACNDCLSC